MTGSRLYQPQRPGKEKGVRVFPDSFSLGTCCGWNSRGPLGSFCTPIALALRLLDCRLVIDFADNRLEDYNRE
jgi:hypothetical protein